MICRAFILPTYNESQTIGALLEKLTLELNDNEVIVVVDDSSVEERAKIRTVLNRFRNIKLLEGEVKGGRGYAVWRGMNYIISNHPEITHIVESDCDGSHRFQDLRKVSTLEANKEFVIGSRYLRDSEILGWSFSRRALSRLLNFLIPLILKLEVKDITNGLRRYSRRAAEFLINQEPTTKGFIYLSEQAKVLSSHKIYGEETPIIFAPRIAGESSVGLKDLLVSLIGLLQIIKLKRK